MTSHSTPATTVEQFVRSLAETHLYSPEEIPKLVEALAVTEATPAQELARRFVEAGKLTRFQADEVGCRRRWMRSRRRAGGSF